MSSPSSSLAASTTSWEISLPVFSIFCSTTSLPAIRIMPKDKNVIASRMGINCSKRLPIYFFIRTLSSISFKYNEYNSFSPSAEPRAGVLYPFRFSYNSFHFVISLCKYVMGIHPIQRSEQRLQNYEPTFSALMDGQWVMIPEVSQYRCAHTGSSLPFSILPQFAPDT